MGRATFIAVTLLLASCLLTVAEPRIEDKGPTVTPQRVILYDEDQNDPKGRSYVGSVVWRTETVAPGSGMAPEFSARADVEIPARHMRMTWSLRRNTDKKLPASHTIEVKFTLTTNLSEGSIDSVPGVLMKSSETARGEPLAGLSVKVSDSYFLIGLSAVKKDIQKNIQLLRDRDWLDIPIVYTSGKRAILAIEKGEPGKRAFAEVFGGAPSTSSLTSKSDAVT